MRGPLVILSFATVTSYQPSHFVKHGRGMSNIKAVWSFHFNALPFFCVGIIYAHILAPHPGVGIAGGGWWDGVV